MSFICLHHGLDGIHFRLEEQLQDAILALQFVSYANPIPSLSTASQKCWGPIILAQCCHGRPSSLASLK
jgi:hypothetical protein